VEPGKGALKTADMEVYVEPLVEWKQMYHETWRIERDFFYDAGLHGLDLATIEKRYAPYVESVASRQDLNYLFEEMLGELTCGHVFVGGGDLPEVKRVGVGLLGADYRIENGRYRFARVYNGENWNPQLRAPLTQPGVNVVAGEYLLAVNGREVTAAEEVYKPFEATAGKQTVIKVGPAADGKGAREVTIIPVGGESGLRNGWSGTARRQDERREAGLRLAPGHGRGRVHELQPLLFRPGRQGGRGYRRALQRGRPDRRLHHRLHAAAAHGLFRGAQRSYITRRLDYGPGS
jgi:tricorn protease